MSDTVGMTRRHVNDQQWFVLSWVADGCPDGVFEEGDHGHKISARALSNRGLVKVRRKAGKWHAQLTETGRYYLENQRFPLAPDADVPARRAATRPESQARVDTRTSTPPKSKPKSPTETLVAAVVRSGGVLCGEALKGYGDLNQLIFAANRFRKTPPGTRLGSFYAPQRGHCLWLLELLGWSASWEEPLKIPERTGRFHPAVGQLRDSGLAGVGRGAGSRRALRILNILARAAEARGYAISAARRDSNQYGSWQQRQPRGDLLIATNNAVCGVRIHHVQEQVPAPEGSWKRVDVVATDRLRLTLHAMRGTDKTWSDTDRRPVDHTLHEVLLQVAFEDAAAVVYAALQREAEEMRALRAEQEAQRRRREEEERERRERLADEVRRWRYAQDIREYCHALRAGGPSPDLQAHVEWALRHADSIDPMVAPASPSSPPNLDVEF